MPDKPTGQIVIERANTLVQEMGLDNAVEYVGIQLTAEMTSRNMGYGSSGWMLKRIWNVMQVSFGANLMIKD